jgi:antiviral helicase SKI2
MINVLSGKCTTDIEKPVKTYSFPLDDFQKHSHYCISKKEHVLVTAHTGSGKTVVADYAIAQCLSENKRVVYTSPIKTLSNQKYKEFSETYPSVGIMTGDIKLNIDAQCVIMTTEILRNLLYKDESQIEDEFKNFMNDVDCVIFDEVHYINDPNRGEVWETCIILMPKRIYMVMLSATIDKSEDFAQWIASSKGKTVNLITNSKRVIPLKHYIYSDGEIHQIMNNEYKFNSETYDKIKQQIVPKGTTSRDKLNPAKLLNPFIETLKRKTLTPALFFIFSRKKCQMYAQMIQTSLLEKEEINRVNSLFDKYIHPYKEKYSDTSQFEDMRTLLHKGVAVHHSGMVPILKEVIEILFNHGLIKVLFATETFAVGVNMPTKTVIFTDFTKFDGHINNIRLLRPDEYRQMSGRAGRRGLDTSGTVIYLPFVPPFSRNEVYNMMTGRVASVQSKFQISYQFVLRVILSQDLNLFDFIDLTLYQKENISNTQSIKDELNEKNKEMDSMKQSFSIADSQKINTILSLAHSNSNRNSQNLLNINKNIPFINNKCILNIKLSKTDRKRMQNEFKILVDEYPGRFEDDVLTLENYYKLEHEIKSLQDTLNYQNNIKMFMLQKIIQSLVNLEYLKDVEIFTEDQIIDKSDEIKNYLSKINADNVTLKGLVCSKISECNEITFTETLFADLLEGLNEPEIAGIMAMFIGDEKTGDEAMNLDEMKISKRMKEVIREINYGIEYLFDKQLTDTSIKMDFGLNLSMVESTYLWAQKNTLAEVYQKTGLEMYEGNFIRNMIRISNICRDLKEMAELTNKMELYNQTKDLEEIIVRDIITVESLYIDTKN